MNYLIVSQQFRHHIIYQHACYINAINSIHAHFTGTLHHVITVLHSEMLMITNYLVNTTYCHLPTRLYTFLYV